MKEQPHSDVRAGLEEVDQEQNGRLPFLLSRVELKLLGIAGVGFFLDAYDLFIINQVSVMLQYRLYGGKSLPSGLEGFIKAGANIGSVIGQFTFGYLADSLGRKAVYGKELMLIIFATIMCISVPTNDLSPSGVLIWIGVFRIVLGVGVGGDYPLSASVMSDRARIWKRGALLCWIFANQGYGSLVGSIVTMITLAAYKGAMDNPNGGSKTDGVWRIIVGLSLIPAAATLYQRLVLPESKRYLKSRSLEEENATNGTGSSDLEKDSALKKHGGETDVAVHDASSGSVDHHNATTPPANGNGTGAVKPKEVLKAKHAHFREFVTYFSEWRHAKILIGTCMCWFLLDIAFYGINLNQSVVLQQIGFDGSEPGATPWHKLFKIATGNLIITALGFVPGYWASIVLVEYIGRKTIQLQGFLMAALFLAILAGKFHSLSTPAFVVCFALLQFFFNFGANTTTFLYPAEVFPTRFRSQRTAYQPHRAKRALSSRHSRSTRSLRRSARRLSYGFSSDAASRDSSSRFCCRKLRCAIPMRWIDLKLRRGDGLVTVPREWTTCYDQFRAVRMWTPSIYRPPFPGL
ncbi:MFS general substrate transporter [Exidia glandulosa HHB12029]|uniref:MFS general substrate transporter n=1 Tax=Exidia glandulosa HHB12029 TaxID=1314781 RepID=A0A165DLM4_EXIGL|nr:MFS general substrate transporter [Exidia glandulosa HHB12029]